MTKETIARMFNSDMNYFYLEKNVMVYRTKRAGKKYFGINDSTKYTPEDIQNDVWKPICEFRTIDELFTYEYKGKTIKEWVDPLKELNIDNFSKE